MGNDKHLKDKIVSVDKSKVFYGNIPPNLILPWPFGPIFPGASAAEFGDCEDFALEQLSQFFGVDHLSECTNTNAKLFEYPITGIVNDFCGCNRFVIPLKVRANRKSQNFIVYFVVDSGAPLISFSKKTAEKIFGSKGFANAIVQDVPIDCRLSGNFNKSMKNLNLLGSQFLLRSNTSLIISPNKFANYWGDMKIFYLTPFSMISQVQTMAASRQQDPNIMKKLEIHSVSKSSDPGLSHKEKIEKAFPPLKKPDESRPSTSSTLTSDSDTQMPSHHGSFMKFADCQ